MIALTLTTAEARKIAKALAHPGVFDQHERECAARVAGKVDAALARVVDAVRSPSHRQKETP